MTITAQRIGGWLDDLASRSPAPGGGSAAALFAASAAGLTAMVANYTTGPKWSDREDRMRELAGTAARIRTDALAAADEDAEAFSAVAAAYGLPKSTPREQAERSARIQQALVAAAGPPVRTGLLGARAVEIAGELLGAGNPAVLSDVAVAASAARAAIEGAIVNIEINRRQIRDETESSRLGRVIGDLEAAAGEAGRLVDAVREKLAQ